MPRYVDDEFLTIPEMCKILKISRATFYRLRTDGVAPPVMTVGKRSMRARRADFDAWVAAREDA